MFDLRMQASNRIKLNRDAFKVEEAAVPKRSRLSNDNRSACALPSRSPARPKRTHLDLNISLVRHPASPPLSSSCTGAEPCPSGTSQVRSTEQGKRVRCHLHVALRIGDKKPASLTQPARGPSISCTVSQYVKGGVQIQTATATPSLPRPLSKQRVGCAGVGSARGGPEGQPTPSFERTADLRSRFGSVTSEVSERGNKRSATSCCTLCGGREYALPAGKKTAQYHKPRPRCCNPHSSRQPDRPGKQDQAKVGPAPSIQPRPRVNIWFGKYLKVKLCDVSRVFDVTSHDYCILPVVLLQKRKHEREKCFKKEFMSLLRLGNGHRGEGVVTKSLERRTPTNRCASFSSGDRVLGAPGIKHNLNVIENVGGSGRTSSKCVSSAPAFKRVRSITACEETGRVKFVGVENCSVNALEPLGEVHDSEPTSDVQVRHVPPLTSQSASHCEQISSSLSSPASADKNLLSVPQATQEEAVGSESSDDEMRLSDTCQRARAYMARSHLSCARTYTTWPFPRQGAPKHITSSVCGGPRWIQTSAATEQAENFTSNSSECTVGKNVSEDLTALKLSDKRFVAQIGQECPLSATVSDVEPSSASQLLPKNLTACHNNQEKRFNSTSAGCQMITGGLDDAKESGHSDTQAFARPTSKGTKSRNTRERFQTMNLRNRSIPIQNVQEQVRSQDLNKMGTDPVATPFTTSKSSVGKNNPAKALESVCYAPVNALSSKQPSEGQGKMHSANLSEAEPEPPPREASSSPNAPSEHPKRPGEAAESAPWILSSAASEATEQVVRIQRRHFSKGRVENERERLKAGSLNDGLQPARPSEPEPGSSASEPLKAHNQKKLKALRRDLASKAESELLHGPQLKPQRFASVRNRVPHPLEICSLNVGNQQNLSSLPSEKQNMGHPATNEELRRTPPVELISVPSTEPVDLCSTSTDWTPSSSTSRKLKNKQTVSSMDVWESSSDLRGGPHPPFVVPSRKEARTSTTMVCRSVAPQSSSLVKLKPKNDQIAGVDVESRISSSLESLLSKTFKPKPSSPISTTDASPKPRVNSTATSDPSSSSGEEDNVSSLSPSDQLVEDDSVQERTRDMGKANESPSPLAASKCWGSNDSPLDVVRAYEEDAIVLDVLYDDPDLFRDVVQETRLLSPKRGPVDAQGVRLQMKSASVRGRTRIVWSEESDIPQDPAGDVSRESLGSVRTANAREQDHSSKGGPVQSKSWSAVNPIIKDVENVPDCNNNLDKQEFGDLSPNAVNAGSNQLVVDTCNNVRTATGKDVSVVRPFSSYYCRYYFSEHHMCFRNVCRYRHLPRDDDEKFCMDTVQRFCRAGSPAIVQRAVEVLVGYYGSSSPGVSFSQNVVNSLLMALLHLSQLKDMLSIINTLLTHKRTPSPELMVALYEHVGERGIHSFVPELILVTSKIIETGCMFSFKQCNVMQLQLEMLHLPRQQLDKFHAVKCRALATNHQTAELFELAQAVVQVEMCEQQEDWSGLGRLFCIVCDGRSSAAELSRFCCCVTVALLKDPKEKPILPYEPFAESVCLDVPSDGLVKSFLGRVGVSLMFTYHRNKDWTKGVRLLGVMSRLRVEFFTLQGLFGSEAGASRCQRLTMAAELFISSGSIEGALNLLRDYEWFVSSAAWPCEQVDGENRRRVLTVLAGKTSYRDTLEVLSNLPGVRQPFDGLQLGGYCSVFNAHLRRCAMNQALPVAADTLEFMLIQGITVDPSMLQHLIHKLGKQNVWSRARTLFNRAHSAGYYPALLCERDSLVLQCRLSEIEMTLAFEMFIACVGSSLQSPAASSAQPLLISLNRASGGEEVKESEYLAAGCRLLSAALIPNPKLSIRYTAVNQVQEQLFHLDRASAAKWLSHNRGWALEMWARAHILNKH